MSIDDFNIKENKVYVLDDASGKMLVFDFEVKLIKEIIFSRSVGGDAFYMFNDESFVCLNRHHYLVWIS